MIDKVGIITGIIHCGSTLLLDMLKVNKRVYADFEIGILNAKSLSVEHLSQWCDTDEHFQLLTIRYGIDRNFILSLSYCSGWYHAYHKLHERMCLNQSIDMYINPVILIDKVPDYALDIDRIQRCMPSSPVVGMIRDPRAVYASWLKRSTRQLSPNEFMNIYNKSMLNMLSCSARTAEMLVIYFEQLVTTTEKVMQLICTHIGIDYDSKMCNPANSPRQHDKTKNQYKPTSHKVIPRNTINGMDLSSLHEYRTLLTHQQQRDILDRLDRSLHWLIQW